MRSTRAVRRAKAWTGIRIDHPGRRLIPQALKSSAAPHNPDVSNAGDITQVVDVPVRTHHLPEVTTKSSRQTPRAKGTAEVHVRARFKAKGTEAADHDLGGPRKLENQGIRSWFGG